MSSPRVPEVQPTREQLLAEVQRLRAQLDALGQASRDSRAVAVAAARHLEQLNAALRESNDRFRQLADAMPQLVWSARADGVVDYYNRRWVEYGGIQPPTEERADWNWAPILHAADLAPTVAAWQRAVQDGQLYQQEHRVLMADGTYRWHLSRAKPWRDEAGAVQRWFGTATDVHDLRLAQDAMRDSEERYRLVAQATNDVIWDWNLDTNELRWNDATLENFGCEPAALGGDIGGWYDRIHPEDRERVVAGIHAALDSGQASWAAEYRFRVQEGRYGTFYDRGHIARDADGRAYRMIGSMLDLTERQAVARQLQDRERQLRAVTSASPDIISRYDRQLRAVFINDAIAKATGRSPAEYLGKTNRDLGMPPELCAEWEAAMEGVFATGEPAEVRFTFPSPSGPRRYHARMVAEPNPEGPVMHLVCITQDVTEEQRAQEALQAAKEEAERANQAKDEFLAALSHELRTPLTPVLLVAQLLESDARLPENVQEDLRLIRRNVELETRLIDDLLDLTRITRGKLQIFPAELDLHTVVRDVMRTCADEVVRDKQLRLECDLQASVSRVWGDATRLGQVLWNVLKNAIKFTPDGGRIVLGSRNPSPDRIRLTVTDTGVGIAPEALPHIFDAFEQGGLQVTRQFGGLGLGLAISRALTELHGGEIAARSEGRNRGAEFVVELPLALAASVAPAPADPPPAGAGGQQRHWRILLVEDHSATAQVLQRLLTGLGHQLQHAGTVAAARELAAQQPFDLALSDIGLPDGSGNALVRDLKRLGVRRCVALSGFGMEDDVQRSLQAGFDAHLVKPVTLQTLAATLAGVMAETGAP